jgi:hypothetical protein
MFRSFIVVALVGCASAENPTIAPDAGTKPDAAPTSQPPSAGDCPDTSHSCGVVCVPRQDNTPQIGCALGCQSACPAVANATPTCTDQGLCDFACATGFSRVGNQCVASACEQGGYTCGTLPSGVSCGTCLGVSCGSDYQCDVPPDASEWNDSPYYATWLGSFDDSDDADSWLTDRSIGKGADYDYYRFHVTDGFDGGNPRIDVEITKRDAALGWLETPHELSVFFDCDVNGNSSTVRCGEWFTTTAENTHYDLLGTGCTVDGMYLPWASISASCDSTDDSGTVTVLVRKNTPPRGDHYDVHVSVH